MKIIRMFLICFSLLHNNIANVAFAAEGTIIPVGAVEVTPEELRELEKQKKEKEKKEKEKKEEEKRKAEEKKQAEQRVVEQDDINLPIHVGANFSGSGSGEGAILVFAIVGTVIVFAWIPYVVMLLYRGFKHPEDYRFRSMLIAQTNRFIDNGDVERVGNMSGLRYTTFIEERKLIANNITQKRFYGLNVEFGNYHFNDVDGVNNRRIGYDSEYWLVGPAFIYGNMRDTETVFFKTDFLAGSSFKNDVDLILRAELSLNYKFESGIVTGLGFGGNYLRGRSGQGFIKYADQLSTHWLFNLGYLF